MPKAKAIAIVYDQSFKPAFDSAANALRAISDFMYGTEARAKMTSLFACAMLIVGTIMNIYGNHLPLTYCAL